MADVYKGLTVKLGVDTSSLSSALRKARSEVSGVATDLRKVERALKLDPGNVKLLAQQQKDYQRQIESTKKQLDLLRQAEKQMEDIDAFTPEQEAQWTKLQSDIVMTEQKLKGYQQALTDSIVKQGAATSLLGKLGSGIESFGSRVQGFGRGMEAVGNGLARTLTPAVIGVGAASVAAAVQIDTSLTNVKKTVDGTDEQYQKLKASAIEFSKTNAVSASQILDIQALGAQLGFAIDELDEFGQVVSGLDIATNMGAEQAATEMAQFANITKMSHGEIRNYGSAIVGLGNSFATTESDISSMAMRIAAAGTQVHMSQADILGLATALASMGVEAEAGGTAISTIMAPMRPTTFVKTNTMAPPRRPPPVIRYSGISSRPSGTLCMCHRLRTETRNSSRVKNFLENRRCSWFRIYPSPRTSTYRGKRKAPIPSANFSTLSRNAPALPMGSPARAQSITMAKAASRMPSTSRLKVNSIFLLFLRVRSFFSTLFPS